MFDAGLDVQALGRQLPVNLGQRGVQQALLSQGIAESPDRAVVGYALAQPQVDEAPEHQVPRPLLFQARAAQAIPAFQQQGLEHQQRRPSLLALLFGMDSRHLLFYRLPVNQPVDAVEFFQGLVVFDEGIAQTGWG